MVSFENVTILSPFIQNYSNHVDLVKELRLKTIKKSKRKESVAMANPINPKTTYFNVHCKQTSIM